MQKYILLILIILVSFSQAQDSSGISHVSRFREDCEYWSGRLNDIVVQDQYTYLATSRGLPGGGGLAVIDNSDPFRPIQIQYVFIPSNEFEGLYIVNDFLYATIWNGFNRTGFLAVFDISDPVNIYEIGRVNNNRGIWDKIVGQHDYIYTANGTVIDISDRESPAIIASYNSSIGSVNIKVYHNYVYILGNGMSILDISDLDSIVEVGAWEFPDEICYDITVLGSYAYIVSGEGLSVIDISDPTSPEMLWESDMDSDYSMRGIVQRDSLLYTTGNGLMIFDISDPESPERVNEFAPPAFWHAAFYGNYICTSYAGWDRPGFRIIDIENPIDPWTCGMYRVARNLRDVAVEGDYAFLIDDELGMRVFDISDLTEPIEVRYSISPLLCDEIKINGNYAYIRGDNKLQVVDITDPLEMTKIGEYASTWLSEGEAEIKGFVVLDDFVIISGINLEVLDVSDPSTPVTVALIERAHVNDISVAGDRAFITNKEGLTVWDVSDLENPEQVTLCEIDSGCGLVEVAGDYAYTSVNDSVIYSIDISDPENPEVVRYCSLPGTIMEIDVYYNRLFVADSADGLRVLDISDPSNPIEIGYYDPYYGKAYGVTVRDNYAFVANDMYFDIFDCSEIMSVSDEMVCVSPAYDFMSAYPNPFNQRTVIDFSLQSSGRVTLKVYDPLGRLVDDLTPNVWLSRGRHQRLFDAENLPTGNYIVLLDADGVKSSQFVTLVK